MEIYLIRHTQPLVAKGICYGRTDVPLDEKLFPNALNAILSQLPPHIDAIYSSPLFRCSHLANQISNNKYKSLPVQYSNLLLEMNFGKWENKQWDDINQPELAAWMNDFIHTTPPDGENFLQLHERTKYFLAQVQALPLSNLLIIAHAGSIRSIITHLQQTELKDAFSIRCDYGMVIRIKTKKC